MLLTRLVVLALLIGCSRDPQLVTNGRGQRVELASAASGVGAKCAASTDCTFGLTCTGLLAPSPECALEWDSRSPCPEGWDEMETATANVGVVSLSDLHVTGFFCVPQCDSFADCANGQCCVSGHGYGGAARGWCETRNPAQQYLAPLSCPP